MSTVLRTGAFVIRAGTPSPELIAWMCEVLHEAKAQGVPAVRVEIHAYDERIRNQIEADPFNTRD